MMSLHLGIVQVILCLPTMIVGLQDVVADSPLRIMRVEEIDYSGQSSAIPKPESDSELAETIEVVSPCVSKTRSLPGALEALGEGGIGAEHGPKDVIVLLADSVAWHLLLNHWCHMQQWKTRTEVMMVVSGFTGSTDVDNDLANFSARLAQASSGSCSDSSVHVTVTSLEGIKEGKTAEVQGNKVNIPSLALRYPQVGRLMVLDADTYCESDPFRHSIKNFDADVQCMPQYHESHPGRMHNPHWGADVAKSIGHFLPKEAAGRQIAGAPPTLEASTASCIFKNTKAGVCFADTLAKFESGLQGNILWKDAVTGDDLGDEQDILNLFLHAPEAASLLDHGETMHSMSVNAVSRQCGAKFVTSTSITDDWDHEGARHDSHHCWHYGFGSSGLESSGAWPSKIIPDGKAVLFDVGKGICRNSKPHI